MSPDRRHAARGRSGEWTAYWNGRFVPQRRVQVSPSDRGFALGDAVYEVTRTYHHRLFHLDWHLDRLYEALAAIRLDPMISRDEMRMLSGEVLRVNLPLVAPDDDVSLTHHVTRGPHRGPFEAAHQGPSTVLITCRRVRFGSFAQLYTHGVDLRIPPLQVPARGGIDPRIKTNSRLLFALASVMVATPDRPVLPLLTDVDGWITETASANAFFVGGTTIQTAPDEVVLGGITRRAVLDLAAADGLQLSTGRIGVGDLHAYDEAFVTATSFAILPVRRINGHQFAPVPGRVTARLTEAFGAQVGVDIVRQAQRAAARERDPASAGAGRQRRSDL